MASAEALIEALENQNEAITLRLTEDMTVEGTLIITSNVTLDLNGQTLTWQNENHPKNNDESLFRVVEGGVLTVTDTSETEGPTFNYQVMESIVNGDGTTTETTRDRTTAPVKNGTTRAATESAVDWDNMTALIWVDGGQLVLDEGVINGSNANNPDWKWVRGVLVLNGGSVVMNGGAVMNCHVVSYGNPHGGAFYVKDGSFTMTGGVIAQNKQDFYGRGGGIDLENGSLDISGGEIVKNIGGCGGGIFAWGGAGTIRIYGNAIIAGNWIDYGQGGGIAIEKNYELTIDDGAFITMNTASSWGGGIKTDSPLTMTGGQITGNVANRGDEVYNGGGGILVAADFVMTGGIVAGNIVERVHGGGGICFEGDTFKMDGGYISNNIAQDGEGGGIRVNGRLLEITRGYITGNKTNTTQHWGGGGIFVREGSHAKIQNLLVTGNTAQGLGGGVAGCSTGELAIATNDGMACFGNKAFAKNGSDPGCVKPEDKAALGNEEFIYHGADDYFCAHSSYVSDLILGGGHANWHGSWDDNNEYNHV